MSRLTALLLAILLAAFAPVHASDDLVDINTADAAELARVLHGVGRSKADAIVAHREKFGPFTNVDELRYVKGIGDATVERNRSRMTVGAAGEEGVAATNGER